ncbi:putative PDF receptor [Hypsibius exemplaris]|uniref:PDF receptor n=1 Tax=Hypsibius exemplaris TaxID=2072580 RepID=A0A1W0WXM1_HYPEX|nr:putative PDF receptor [Hypsibius exemplaris]
MAEFASLVPDSTEDLSHLNHSVQPETRSDIYNSLLSDAGLKWAGLTAHQQAQLQSVETDDVCDVNEPGWGQCLRNAYKCYIDSWNRSAAGTAAASGNCPVKYDGHQCWEEQKPGLRSLLPCTKAIPTEYHFCKDILPSIDLSSLHAYRLCGADGAWVNDGTDYTTCHGYMEQCSNMSDQLSRPDPFNFSSNTPIPDLLDVETKRIVIYLFTGLAVTSMILLAISLFIFSYFKTLYCNRNSIHINLIVSLMLHTISLLVILTPTISGNQNLQEQEWLCKSFVFLSFYAVAASIMWTFVEGLYLSQRLTLAVFKKEAPFKLYYFIGWGFPLVLATTWAIVTELVPYTDLDNNDALDLIGQQKRNVCWRDYSKQSFHWIITGPCLAALVVNFIFLVMIIIVLVTKLRANNAVETVQVRKAIKATFILVPLLGISNLLFVANPNDNGFGQKAYIVVNLILKGSQGIFVALIYCFLNSEVQMAVQKKVYRAALRRNPETQSFRFGSMHIPDPALLERRKSSTRTGSTTLVSSTEVLRALFRSRRSSSRTSHHNRHRNPSLYNVPVPPVSTPPLVNPVNAVDDWTAHPASSKPFVRDRVNSSVTFSPVLITHDSLSEEGHNDEDEDEEAFVTLQPLTGRLPAEAPPPSAERSTLPRSGSSYSYVSSLPQKSALSNGHHQAYLSGRQAAGSSSVESPAEDQPLMMQNSSSRFPVYYGNNTHASTNINGHIVLSSQF